MGLPVNKDQALRLIVLHQSNIECLWGDAEDGGKVSINEALLRFALRHLHAVIEDDHEYAAKVMPKYWNVESET